MPEREARVLHLLSSLNRRGAELCAVRLADRMSRAAFQPAIWTIAPARDGWITPDQTQVIERRRNGSQPTAYGAFADLVDALRAFQPDIVHCHGGRALKYAVAAKPLGRGRATVYTKIGSVHPWLDHPAKRRFSGFLMERVDAIVAVAERLRQEVEETFHPRRPRLVTIPTGVDPSPFVGLTPSVRSRQRAELGLDPADVCLITVGSLSWEKDPLAVIRLFAELAPTGRSPELPASGSVRLVIVGDGPLGAECRREAEALGIADRVRFLGVRPDVPTLLFAADIFVLTSRTEGLPAVLIEAGLAGCPAVAFGVGAVGEVLLDGETGFVVSPGDLAGFRAQLLRLIEDRNLRARLGARATAWCRETFDVDRYVERHQELYRQLLDA